MELAKLVLEFVKALAWPATTFALFLIFRAPIYQILSRIRKAGLPGGVSIDFQEEVQEATQLSKQIESAPPPPGRPQNPTIPLTEANARMISLGLRPTASGLDFTYYREIAGTDPNLALAGLRIEIEILANNLAQGFQVDLRKPAPLNRLLLGLHSAGAITAEQLKLIQGILRICNQAVHGTRVTYSQSDEVIESAKVLAEQYLSWLSWGFPDDWKPKLQSSTND